MEQKKIRVILKKISLTHIQRGEVLFLEEIENMKMNIQRGDEEVSQRPKWKQKRVPNCQN